MSPSRPTASRNSACIARIANGIDAPQTMAVADTANVIMTQFSWALRGAAPGTTLLQARSRANPRIAALMLFVTVQPYLSAK